MKIKKYEKGSPVYSGLSTLNLKLEVPDIIKPIPRVSKLQFPSLVKLNEPKLTVLPSIANSQTFKTNQFINQISTDWNNFKQDLQKQWENPKLTQQNTGNSEGQTTNIGNQATAAGIKAISSNLARQMTDGMFGDSYIGQNLANIFSQGVSSAGNTMATNLLKGEALTQGLGQNVGQSVGGAALGLGANLVGQGINSIGGDSRLSRGVGQGIATGIANANGIVNGVKNVTAASKAIKDVKQALSTAKNAGDMAKNQTLLSNLKSLKGAQLTNLASIGGQVLGSALSAATGPSKEYGGKYGGITQKADMAYDLTSAAVGFIPGVGTGISSIMALNKGLSNIFGSTDGMTVQDAILGSAFMPAPVKWLNMAGATTTGTFNNQSWQNQQKADSFMGNAFGNLGDKFAKAKDEAGKTYGTFSRGAASEAQDNINFANSAWYKILAMADQNELQNIRSQYMTSINNQRYAQQIGGAYQPISRGRYGMKILNNATNHNIGMRLLSGAALIDNKQMILCSVVD